MTNALQPRTLDEALEIRAARPDAVAVAGGTDLMVTLNAAHEPPPALLDLSHVAELQGWHRDGGSVVVGAGMTFARIGRRARRVPAARGGGALGRVAADPEPRDDRRQHRDRLAGRRQPARPGRLRGDDRARLDRPRSGASCGATSSSGRSARRSLRTSSSLGVEWPVVDAPGSFAKVGTRNAMVIAIADVCVQLDPDARAVRVALGSVAPTVVRAPAAEAFASAALDWDDPERPVPLGGLHRVRPAGGRRRPADRRHPWLGRLSQARGRRARSARPPLDVLGPEGGRVLIRTVVNGVLHELEVEPAATLLAVLRDDLGLAGAKNACEQGECGSCSVWLDGDVVCACLVPAVQVDGRNVRTVEGLGADRLHAVQEAFLDAGAVQCGFCTPGLVVAAVDLLERDPSPDDETIREALAGNLCRCTGYQKIVDAVHLAAGVVS